MKRNVSVTVSECFYYMFFSILFFAKAIGWYDGQPAFKICLVLAAGCVLVKILLTGYEVRELIAMAALLFLGGIVYLNSGEKSALIFLIMMIGFKNISLKRMMKVGLAVWTAGFGIMVFKSVFGIGEKVIFAHHKFGMDLLRDGMGYSHPNVLHVSYAVLVVLLLFTVKESKERWKIYLWTFVGNVVVFLYSVSYTGFLLVTMFILFNLYFTYRKKYSKAEKVLIQCVFPFSVLFALFAPLLVEPDTLLFLFFNKLFNNRFYASRLYLQENGLSLLGKEIYASHTYALDSSYVTLLLYGGILLFLLVCAGYIYSIFVNSKRGEAKKLSILLSFAIAGMIEPFLFNLSFKNLSLLVVAGDLFTVCGKEKQIGLLSFLDREFQVGVPILGEKQQTGKYRKKTLLLSGGLAVIAGILFFGLAPVSDPVSVNADHCDVEEIEVKAQEIDGEEVYIFEGDTLMINRVRDTVRIIFIVFLTGYMICPYVFRDKALLRGTENEK